jgi:hypothetical protein
MFRFLDNINEFFTDNYFAERFINNVFEKAGYKHEQLAEFNKMVSPLKEKYFKFKNSFLQSRRTEDRVKLTHDFHSELLTIFGYSTENQYDDIVYLNPKQVIPIRLKLTKDNKPFLYIMEMQAMIQIDDNEPDGIFDQVYRTSEWKKVFEFIENGIRIKPDAINEAISELFLLHEDERPTYVLMLAGSQLFLIHYDKWKRGSYLLIKLEELFDEIQLPQCRDYYSLLYTLVAKEHLAGHTDNILGALDEDSHKAAFAVTKDLKIGIVNAVELLANESVYYLKQQNPDGLNLSDDFARELKDDCLQVVYRLLFLFYAESRNELDILPITNQVYQKGYSLEMLRDLEQVPLNSESSRQGYFFHDSLWNLFKLLNRGYNPHADTELVNSFVVRPLDTPLFDDTNLHIVNQVKFRNVIWQQIIQQLSLSQEQRGQNRGRISYANLGINQIGSVYESLLAFSGHFANEDLIEVKRADDPSGKEGTFLVPRSRRDDFKEDEILKDPADIEKDVIIKKDSFVYRLNGRDRQKSASYYTPEVLTRTTVKYTLKHILERVSKKEMPADELLNLKILEPAMGAAAFHNETINQLAEAYLEYKQDEVVAAGGSRIAPGDFITELQKVKSYMAINNVYGVDLNPTAIELGKLSLWLNVIHRNMQTPYFGHKLGVGNAVVGCWRKVYRKSEILINTKDKKAPAPKWWENEPKRLDWKTKRRVDEIYNFILPDGNMVPVSKVNFFKEEAEQEATSLLTEQEKLLDGTELKAALRRKSKTERVNQWRKDFCKPFTSDEFKQLQLICSRIDELFEEQYRFQASLIDATRDRSKIYGQNNPDNPTLELAYNQKDELTRKRYSASAPYFKLKLIMDYWCALWFWDAADALALPTRDQYLADLRNLLDITEQEVNTYIEEKIQGDETSNDFAQPQPIQQKLFGAAEPTQLYIGQQLRKREKSVTQKALIDLSFKNPDTLYADNNRLQLVNSLAKKYFFFHYELEFIEVFEERQGFDVIVGNPPWVKIIFEEKNIFAEKFPELEIRSTTAPQVRKLQEDFFKDQNLLFEYRFEYIGTESTSIFLNALQNFPLLIGQQTNLYKCVLENGFRLLGGNGYMGLVHPEGVYDDPNGQILRAEIYKRLKFHFHFRNALKLFAEVHDQQYYSVNIYHGSSTRVDFISMSNICHPSTIDGSFLHDGNGLLGGIKVKDKKTNNFIWNLLPHKNRIVKFNEEYLKIIEKTFEGNENFESTKLVAVHASSIIKILSKLSEFRSKVEDYNAKVSVCWDETNDVNNKSIKRGSNSKYPLIDNHELIINGPHFYVSNPFYKTPLEICKLRTDYDTIDLNNINDIFLPRTNYLPDKWGNNSTFFIPCFSDGNEGFTNWLNYYKLGFRKMLNQPGERTLTSAILLPKSTHTNGVISITFKENSSLLELAALSSSVILDFFIKTIGASNLTDSRLSAFPLGIVDKYKSQLFNRTLRLNCLNKYYAPLWQENYNKEFTQDNWSIIDQRLKPFNTLTLEWKWETPLRNYFERRMALVEIDVIVAMALGLTLEELVLIYNVQFPVLQQNEDDTWYDKKGNIVFTCSKGLTGVGLDRPQWEQVKNNIENQLVEHTITKSELYQGKKVTYYPPFEKCDRVEDYKRAWEHFEGVFNK